MTALNAFVKLISSETKYGIVNKSLFGHSEVRISHDIKTKQIRGHETLSTKCYALSIKKFSLEIPFKSVKYVLR